MQPHVLVSRRESSGRRASSGRPTSPRIGRFDPGRQARRGRADPGDQRSSPTRRCGPSGAARPKVRSRRRWWRPRRRSRPAWATRPAARPLATVRRPRGALRWRLPAATRACRPRAAPAAGPAMADPARVAPGGGPGLGGVQIAQADTGGAAKAPVRWAAPAADRLPARERRLPRRAWSGR